MSVQKNVLILSGTHYAFMVKVLLLHRRASHPPSSGSAATTPPSVDFIRNIDSINDSQIPPHYGRNPDEFRAERGKASLPLYGVVKTSVSGVVREVPSVQPPFVGSPASVGRRFPRKLRPTSTGSTVHTGIAQNIHSLAPCASIRFPVFLKPARLFIPSRTAGAVSATASLMRSRISFCSR